MKKLVFTFALILSLGANAQKFNPSVGLGLNSYTSKTTTEDDVAGVINLEEVDITDNYHIDVVVNDQKDKLFITTNNILLNKFRVINSDGKVKYRRKRPGQIFKASKLKTSDFIIKVKTQKVNGFLKNVTYRVIKNRMIRKLFDKFKQLFYGVY